jgi:N-acetyl sugar amidotransferase
MIKKPNIKYCKKCVSPIINLITSSLTHDNICTGCIVAKEKKEINWKLRFRSLKNLLKKQKNTYDCLIPVSGGKDSYFQTHIIKKILGLNPLLVTYNSNNYSKTGMENLINMKKVFGVDHIFFTPSIDIIKKLNRLGMIYHGDMNWHGHAGIFTYPIIIAVKFKIPFIVWGEHGFLEISGMHSNNDFIEFNKRERKELGLHNLDWYDFLKVSKKFKEKLEKKNLFPFMYPEDDDIKSLNLRGIYLSNYCEWNPVKNTKLMIKKYGFKIPTKSFERTYRKISNLDDIHENGIHDYMKYIKFGYGRCTDHAIKDIRSGHISRNKAILLIKKMDCKLSSDLKRWTKYVGWSKNKFLKIADNFRDPKVWWIKNGYWYKNCLWSNEAKFEKVKLNKKYWSKYYIEK